MFINKLQSATHLYTEEQQRNKEFRAAICRFTSIQCNIVCCVSDTVAFRHEVLNDSSLYDIDLYFDEFDENATLNEDFTSSINMSFNGSFHAPYLRAYANNDPLECDATYTNDVTTGRSSAACDVTVAIVTNLTVMIRAEVYLPPDYVLFTRYLMVQFGDGKCTLFWMPYTVVSQIFSDVVLAQYYWATYSCTAQGSFASFFFLFATVAKHGLVST